MPKTLPRIFRSTATVLAASTLAALAAAAPASADSIAYIKEGNVWLSTTDGARQYQVTFDGGYSTVSQSDGERIVAQRGDRIVTVNRNGGIIHTDGSTKYDIITPHSYTQPSTPFRGPFDPVISPNGMKIAYTWYYTQTGETSNCNPSNGCQTVYGRQGTGYISPDGKSPFDKPGWNEQTGWVGPSWTDDGQTIISDPIQVGNEDVVVHTPGDDGVMGGLPGGINRWFFDPSAPGGLSDGEMTRDKKKLAFITGEQHEKIFLYRAKGGYPFIPENCFALPADTGRASSPSWSTDGTTLAYADGDGIKVIAIPDATNDCGDPSNSSSKLLIPGASYPDWGPADVPPARPAPTPVPTKPTPTPGAKNDGKTIGGGNGKGQNGSGSDSGTGAESVDGTATAPNGPAITLAKKVRLATALRSGLSVQVSGLGAGRVKVTATSGGKKVASGTGKLGASGRGTVKLTFSAQAKRSLRARRSVALTFRAGAATGKLTLKP
ncbi:MAG: hypothetical protein Q7T55_04210 [Solirubrobacteraceae bacterium]|nr:hypothetical protein [Solirubrobacteraceae bacterium]